MPSIAKIRSTPDRPHVVVLGAGFAGVAALQRLRGAPVRVTLVDRKDYHAFLPLIYQVATSQLGPEHITSPAKDLPVERDGSIFVRKEVTDLDLRERRVDLSGRDALFYDYLLIGLGAVVNFFNTQGANEHSFPLYTVDDALRLRAHIAKCLELGRTTPRLVDDGILCFAVTGGGATGVETAGALAELLGAEIARTSGSDSPPTEVHLFEMGTDLLMPFKPTLRKHAKQALERRGVQVHLGEAVAKVEPTRVHFRSGQVLKAHTAVWAAGLQANPVAASLQAQLDMGRPVTEPDLSLSGHPEVFLAGDMAAISATENGEVLPQLGSVAQQSGNCAGANIARLAKGQPTQPFVYRDKGTMAMIGNGDAVVQLKSGRTLTGKPAWLAWKAVHLMLLRGGEQKARTLLEWAGNPVSRRSAR